MEGLTPNPPQILMCAAEELLWHGNIGKCYGSKTLKLGISVEHYRYLVEQIVSLRMFIAESKRNEDK